MTCEQVCQQLTAYLEGELEGDAGRAVRGHLRECEACRGAASDEAALRDGLRSLPPIDPPATLWAGIQGQLAAEEIAEGKRPRWRRWLSGWVPVIAPVARIAAGGLVAAAVVVAVIWWRSERAPNNPVALPTPAPSTELPAPPPPPAPKPVMPREDVTAVLAAEAADMTAAYAANVEELLAIAREARTDWTAERQAEFDANLATLQRDVDTAGEGRPRQRALRSLIRYLGRAAARDEVMLASGGAR